MPKNLRNRISRNRIRYNFMEKLTYKKIVIFCSIFIVLIIGIIVALTNLNFDNTKINTYKDTDINDITQNINSNANKDLDNNVLKNSLNDIINNNDSYNDNLIKMNLLGEVMMGGRVTKSLDYMYNTSFSSIHSFLNNSDFNYITLSTVITNLDEIESPKSSYVVTEEILSVFNSLEINGINLASDHMTDYPKNLFDNTNKVITEKGINVAGLYDLPMYYECKGKKISVIAANDVYLNNSKTYIDYGINVYDKERMKNLITKAKDSSDFVIIHMHWGRENEFKVTNTMRNTAKYLIDNGADLIIGDHALGNYPISVYKGVPIIYSLGNLITENLDYIERRKYVYSVYINELNKIEKIEMLPIYINLDYTLSLYKDYSNAYTKSLNKQYNNWQCINGLDSEIVNDKIVVNF